MSDNTLISILSAVHNEEAHIDEMIESVRSQSHQTWELIFVSDGSTDGTEDLIRKAARTDPRIRLEGDGRKIGKSAAFNTAFARSIGDVIVLLAGDDTLPRESLSKRASIFDDIDVRAERAVAYFKLVTMSEDPRHHGTVLPRGDAGAHSGGTMVMTRALAAHVFPIDERLVAEDQWLSYAAEGSTDDIREETFVVLNYRVHDGNSHPRMQPFASMSASMAKRHEAWNLLLRCSRLQLSSEVTAKLQALYQAELLRRRGRILRLAMHRDLPLKDRLAFIAMSSKSLYALRQRFYMQLSGRRSR